MSKHRAALDALSGLTFAKGHGTGNDFVLIADPDGTVALEAEKVAALADRHHGIGGDGVIRAVPSKHLAEGQALLAEHPDAEWFMDYRNADGSVSEMCGNGVRVFVHFLVSEQLVPLEPGQTLAIGTRAGVKHVTRLDHGYAIDMGPWSYIDPELAQEAASDSVVEAAGLEDPRPALSISMGNPHTVVPVQSFEDLAELDLTRAPHVEPAPENGTNVEFVAAFEPMIREGVGRVKMRVHERGVGETQSCGTGACAAATAMRAWAGSDGCDSWLVEVPGGLLAIDFLAHADGTEHVVLAGPAELVFRGTLG
ncbi:diaminopimelate epimerase [Micrococcus lylae]|uniref:diaminopimelate epimerase n=1 Tax=Micrococcus lylae TaxID=1273 RepID=UPI0021A5F581|nr:diaminopimelate epimerase [Micrococcus lylae]MCT2007071.1 diaminopimelate epimerase [Micrococcus lylae]MCT2070869.1 diaminopimelate epimerase [Micrococcus lylae]